MPSIVKQRLDKWNKTSRRFQKVDVDSFCLWLGKSKEQIIEEFYSIEKAIMLERWKRDYGDYIYQWYKDLMKGTTVLVRKRGTDEYRKEKRSYKHNTARRMAYTMASFLRKTCSNVIFENTIPKATETTQVEHEFVVEQLKRMFTCGDVEERAILQLGVNLALRVEDFSELLREPFEKAVKEVKEGKATTPYGLKIETGKEKIIARAQLTQNTIEVLSTYLKMKETSKYLFSENHREEHITPRQLNYCLKRLWEKAYPRHKKESDNIHWHLLRKYLITMMLNNDIDTTAIKLVVGKSVNIDLKTYLQKVNLSNEFIKVLPYVELGSFIAIQPRTLEQQRARELMMIEAIKQLADKLEKVTGERPKVSIPLKEEVPTTEELKDLFNGNNDKKSKK